MTRYRKDWQETVLVAALTSVVVSLAVTMLYLAAVFL